MAKNLGAKVKSQIESPIESKGNPEFNLRDAEPVDPGWKDAPGAITDEDMALDRELERMAKESPLPDVEPEPANIGVKAVVETRELLGDLIDGYKPAETIRDLEDQIQLAKVNGCDSVECTMKLGRYYVKDGSLDTVGYFMCRDIKVYVEGWFDRARARDRRTIFDIENKR